MLIYPTDIGQWVNYSPYHNQDQISLQKQNLNTLNLENSNGKVKFIYSKYLHELNNALTELSKLVKICDTETILETEVYYTAKIEGAKTTRLRTSELHNGAPIGKDTYSEYMTRNGFDAVKYLSLYNNKLTEDILIKTWDILTHNCCDNLDIKGTKYRSGNIYVGSHVGASPETISSLMNKWLDFYNSQELNNMPFIKASILHFVFESIHPFCDGNGRMGRLLINNCLISQNIENARAVSFSMQIDKTRSAYDTAFVDAENTENDITPFLTYMLNTMLDAYATAFEIQNPKTPNNQFTKNITI